MILRKKVKWVSHNKFEFPQHKRILFAVLNWGLGHATRSIPIIEKLLHNNNQIIIASDGLALQYLQDAFPDIPTIKLISYDIQYKYESIVWNLFTQSLKIRKAIKNENETISTYVHSQNIDMVISDNRYGCYCKGKQNVIVTHQLNPHHTSSIISYFGKSYLQKLLRPFSEIWVPDEAGSLLSGKLSQSDDSRVKYIGLPYRFSPCQEQILKGNILILLSGPEPQRTILEKLLLKEMYVKSKVTLIRGSNIPMQSVLVENWEIINIATTEQLYKILCESSIVISRSGYSTLIDLYQMNKTAILIPTPGQSEQEYLAQHHNKRWTSIQQNEMNLINEIISNAEKKL